MADLPEMSRVLYCHDWQRIEHWASALDELADLSDGEILELQRLGASQMCQATENAIRRPWFLGLQVVVLLWSLLLKLFGDLQARRLPAGG